MAPLAISLRQHGLETCGYHGDKMTANDKQKALENWKEGTIQVKFGTNNLQIAICAMFVGNGLHVSFCHGH